MFKTLREDIAATIERDPAARSWVEVVLCYPGFQAVQFYRVSNFFWRRKLYLLGRWVSAIGRMVSGIEIHPGARVGKGFFVDHGMGVVVGETSHIGDNVTLYHDVTLGGVAPSVDSHSQRNQKRHPTLEDDVIVGSGAQVLGPITIGRGARVGANAVVTKDVPPGATVVVQTRSQPTRRKDKPPSPVISKRQFRASRALARQGSEVLRLRHAIGGPAGSAGAWYRGYDGRGAPAARAGERAGKPP